MLRDFVAVGLGCQIILGAHARAAGAPLDSNRTAQVSTFAADTAAVADEAQNLRTLLEEIKAERAAFDDRSRRFNENPVDSKEKAAILAQEKKLNQKIDRSKVAQGNLRRRINFLEVAPGQVEWRRVRIEKLREERDKIARLLERLQKNSKWQAELDTWIKESEDGQLDVFMTAGGFFLGGLVKPLGQMIETDAEAAARFARAGRAYARELQHLEVTLGELIRGGEERVALQATTSRMREIHKALQEARAKKDEAALLLNFFKVCCQSGSQAAQGIRLSGVDYHDAFHRGSLEFFKEFGKVSGGILVSTFSANRTEVLEQAGKTAAAASIRISLLAVDVAYQLGHLWMVGENVDQVIRTIDDLNKARAELGGRIIQLTDEQIKLQTEIDRWIGRGKHSPEQIRELLVGRS